VSYLSVVQMASSQSLLSRIIAAAAAEGVAQPQAWAQENVWRIVSSPGWADAWAYAVDTATDEHNPDTGKRPTVISDPMILAAVQALAPQPVEPVE
jgi:hypothetical protein